MECSSCPSAKRCFLHLLAVFARTLVVSLCHCLEGGLAALQDHGCLSEEETALVIFECLKVENTVEGCP